MDWSGNVRELKNSIERLAILCEKQIEEKDIDKYIFLIDNIDYSLLARLLCLGY